MNKSFIAGIITGFVIVIMFCSSTFFGMYQAYQQACEIVKINNRIEIIEQALNGYVGSITWKYI